MNQDRTALPTTYSVKFQKPYRWAIFQGNQVVEGGFFSRQAASDYMEHEYVHPAGHR